MLKFAANLSMLWRELRFGERFGRAAGSVSGLAADRFSGGSQSFRL